MKVFCLFLLFLRTDSDTFDHRGKCSNNTGKSSIVEECSNKIDVPYILIKPFHRLFQNWYLLTKLCFPPSSYATIDYEFENSLFTVRKSIAKKTKIKKQIHHLTNSDNQTENHHQFRVSEKHRPKNMFLCNTFDTTLIIRLEFTCN